MPTTKELLEAIEARRQTRIAETQGRTQDARLRVIRRADRKAEETFRYGRAVLRRGDFSHDQPGIRDGRVA